MTPDSMRAGWDGATESRLVPSEKGCPHHWHRTSPPAPPTRWGASIVSRAALRVSARLRLWKSGSKSSASMPLHTRSVGFRHTPDPSRSSRTSLSVDTERLGHRTAMTVTPLTQERRRARTRSPPRSMESIDHGCGPSRKRVAREESLDPAPGGASGSAS